MEATKLGVLISGRGSNMKSIVAACDSGDIPADVVLVVSNTSSAPGLEWARESHTPDHAASVRVQLVQRTIATRDVHAARIDHGITEDRPAGAIGPVEGLVRGAAAKRRRGDSPRGRRY